MTQHVHDMNTSPAMLGGANVAFITDIKAKRCTYLFPIRSRSSPRNLTICTDHNGAVPTVYYFSALTVVTSFLTFYLFQISRRNIADYSMYISGSMFMKLLMVSFWKFESLFCFVFSNGGCHHSKSKEMLEIHILIKSANKTNKAGKMA